LVEIKPRRFGSAGDAGQNGDKYQKEIQSGGGFISQSDLRVHFGLGKAEKQKKS